MIEQIPTDEEARLEDRLKREADALRPSFSEALHEQICRALPQRRRPRQPRADALRLRHGWLSVAIAATLLASVPLVGWRLGRSPSVGSRAIVTEVVRIERPGPPAGPELITESAARTVERVSMLVDSTVSDGRWAYLDHDARVALQLLMDQMPLDVASME